MPKRKSKLSTAQRRDRRERRKNFQTIFINGKQKRVPREPTIEGIPVDEFIARNADPIWLLQEGLYDELHRLEQGAEMNDPRPSENPWPFDNPPNTASLTTTFVLDGSPILRVYRDFDDGGYQFHGSPDQPATEDVALVVTLGSIIELDPSLVQLHDLPPGWRAFRGSIDDDWMREKNNPFPTHEENGYYLEDAVWMSQYCVDVNPPPEAVRDHLPVGACVKLLFRFAAENAKRHDGEVERMWVRVVSQDDDENYIGVLENDPFHDRILTCGATIHFHSLHVMQIFEE